MSAEINDKHLTLVQGVVNRLAGNSFSIKGWSMTLVSALVGLGAKDASPWLIAVALLPALTLWGLDGYFLAQEKLFRGLYDRLIDPNDEVPPYSMKTAALTRALWKEVTFSTTLKWFHGVLVAVIVGALVVVLVFGRAASPPAAGQATAAPAVQPAPSPKAP